MWPRAGCLLLLCSLAWLATAAPVRSADGSLEVAPKESEEPNAPAGPKVKLYSASKALVIGIDAYGGSGWFRKGTGWPKLSMAVKDAEEVANALSAQGFAVTLKKDLGSADLDQAFRQFFIGEGADPEARLFIWFAGHGHTISGEGYLVPADAPDPRTADVEFRSRALSLRRFGEYMREARAKHVLAVFDSCFGGSVFNVARARPPRAITLATTQTVRQFISSGDSNQVVSDNGAFRRLFVDAIEGREPDADANGDGFITGTELGLFVSDKVTNYSEKGQTPRYGKLNAQGYDRGDFVLERARLAALPASVPAAAPLAGASSGSAQSEIERAWGLVQTSESVPVLEAFRKQYGAGNALYDQLAANRISALNASAEKRKADEAAAAEARRKEEEQRVAMLAEEERKKKTAEEAARKAVAVPKIGETFHDCPDCPEMVVVPAGAFLMGSPESEEGRYDDEGPQRTVNIAEPFAVGKFEVTRDEFEAFVSAAGHKVADECYQWTGSEWKKQSGSYLKPGFEQTGRHPAVCVRWDDAKAYVAWLSKKTGQSYRLLTEAEWEYAARGVTAATPQPRYHFGNDADGLCDYANGADQSAKQKFKDWTVSNCTDGNVFTAPTGSFKPNAFGLFDMHGNVWEWVEDCYHDSYKGAPDDGSAWTTACTEGRRVLRGGSWGVNPRYLRSASRFGSSTVDRVSYFGFRVARSLTP